MDQRPTHDLTDQPIAWRPTPEMIARSRVLAFARTHGFNDYDDLVRAANDRPEWFWEAVVDHLGIDWSRRFDTVLDLNDGIEWPHWFVGGRMNYVTSAVDRFLPARSESTAVIWEGDDGRSRTLTFAELAAEINRLANALTNLGASRGTRIGIYMPMLPETAIAMLACGKIGAVFVPIFSGFGADAVRQRLVDAKATILITSDGFARRGNVIDLKAAADRAVAAGTDVERVLVVRHTEQDVPWDPNRDVWWHEAVATESHRHEPADTAANDPFMIIYTSGTTGQPKGAVHVHSGFPIKAAQDLAFCFDLQADERLCWLTDLGWMMGPWAIAGTLIAGGCVVLFEGTPDYPAPDRLWQIVERHSINVLGVSPTAMRALMAKGDEWVENYRMESLRAIGSTGEPWNPAPWRWTSKHVGRGRCPIVNYSGGTEIGGGIISSTTIHPQKPASFHGPIPGVPADVADPHGNSVRGDVGELIIRGPWVGMTAGFLDDPERYLNTYWRSIPGVWTHGDWAFVDDEGFWYILGRSDDTLNIAGKRIGPAELESAAVAHPAVQEAAAIGVPDDVKGTAAVVFAILKDAYREDDGIESEISDLIADQLGRPLRPKSVVIVDDLPRTRNAKIMR
ncbi:MAG: AMP-binding protein, partial [Chloroflexota bacterium]